jgi:hypothetical protein
MPAKSAKSARGATTKPSARKRSTTKPTQRRPDHDQIAERAYYIHLHEGSSDEVANWLRAERELTVA